MFAHKTTVVFLTPDQDFPDAEDHIPPGSGWELVAVVHRSLRQDLYTDCSDEVRFFWKRVVENA